MVIVKITVDMSTCLIGVVSRQSRTQTQKIKKIDDQA